MIPRLYVHYGDAVYTVSERSAEDVCSEVEGILQSGAPGWLEVNYGEGRPTPTRLLVTAGTAIAIREDPTHLEH